MYSGILRPKVEVEDGEGKSKRDEVDATEGRIPFLET